jgi:hypothetical protein
MEVLTKLSAFIESAKSFRVMNEWLDDDKMQVYVRKGIHMIDGKVRTCLDVANVEVYVQQEGTWTDFIWKAHGMNPWDCTYIECVHNPVLAAWLLKNGFLPTTTTLNSFYVSGHESFYLPTSAGAERWNNDDKRRNRSLETRIPCESS